LRIKEQATRLTPFFDHDDDDDDDDDDETARLFFLLNKASCK